MSRAWVFACLVAFGALCASLFLHTPSPSGDTVAYLEGMRALFEGADPSGYAISRIITGFGGLSIVYTLSLVFGDPLIGWILMNAMFFVVAALFFFALAKEYFESTTLGLWAEAFFVTSYGMFAFALQPLMDIAGWASLIACAYFCFRYLKSPEWRYSILAALAIGLGTFFKEYALLGTLLVAGTLSYEHLPRAEISAWLMRGLSSACIALLPITLISLSVYATFDSTYFDWLGKNEELYGTSYSSRLWEYMKVLGSFYHFGWFLALAGSIIILREGLWREKRFFFLASLFFSMLPVFIWPAIIQRLFTIFLPSLVILSLYPLARFPRTAPVYGVLLVVYIAISFAMDAYIFNAVNIDVLFGI